MDLSQLQPKPVWDFFSEICRIPRPSKHEEKILLWLKEFANSKGLSYKSDKAGNLLISKPASAGRENRPTAILQAHVDMVCEKNSDVEHDFMAQAIEPRIDGEWVKAKGTTLGADDGIGIAAILAIFDDNKLEHGPLEALFTVDEETGLTGAFALEKDLLSGKILINLDSEDEGELFIGCAGGMKTTAVFKPKYITTPDNMLSIKISISGLRGGHSGDDINKNRGNAIKILSGILYNPDSISPFMIAGFEGGNLHNAIPREASAILCVDIKDIEIIKNNVRECLNKVAAEMPDETGFKFIIEETALPQNVMETETVKGLFEALTACPNGVITWSTEMEGLVETSTNLASVKLTSESEILITTSQRSSIDNDRKELADRIRTLFEMAGATAESSEGYPGWKPNLSSPILETTKYIYKSLFGNDPKVRAIHAGLECGLFLEKYPGLDMISFGPTLRDVHSPDERLHIPTVDKFYRLLTEVLAAIE